MKTKVATTAIAQWRRAMTADPTALRFSAFASAFSSSINGTLFWITIIRNCKISRVLFTWRNLITFSFQTDSALSRRCRQRLQLLKLRRRVRLPEEESLPDYLSRAIAWQWRLRKDADRAGEGSDVPLALLRSQIGNAGADNSRWTITIGSLEEAILSCSVSW